MATAAAFAAASPSVQPQGQVSMDAFLFKDHWHVSKSREESSTYLAKLESLLVGLVSRTGRRGSLTEKTLKASCVATKALSSDISEVLSQCMLAAYAENHIKRHKGKQTLIMGQ